MFRHLYNDQKESNSILALASKDTISADDLARLKVLLDQGAGITEYNAKSETAIVVAAAKSHWQVVLLIAQNRKTDAADQAQFGRALLEITSSDSRMLDQKLKVATALLDAGATPINVRKALPWRGRPMNSVEIAVLKGNIDMVRLFFSRGVDPWQSRPLGPSAPPRSLGPSIVETAVCINRDVVAAILETQTPESLQKNTNNCQTVLNNILTAIIYPPESHSPPELLVIEKLLDAGIPADKEKMAEFVKIVFARGYDSIMPVLVEQDIRPENISSLGINNNTVSYFIACLEKFAAQHATMGEEQYHYYRTIVESVVQDKFNTTTDLSIKECKKFYECLVYFLLTQSAVLFDRPVLGHVLALRLCLSLLHMSESRDEAEQFNELKKHCYAVLLDEKKDTQEIDAARNRLLRQEQKMAELKPYNDRLTLLTKQLGKTYQERRQELEDKTVQAKADQQRLLDVKIAVATLQAERDKLAEMIQKLQVSKLSKATVLQLENLSGMLSWTAAQLLQLEKEEKILTAAKPPEQLAKEMTDLEMEQQRLVSMESEIEALRVVRNAKDRALSDAYQVKPLALNEMAYRPLQYPYLPAKTPDVKAVDKEKLREIAQLLEDFETPRVMESNSYYLCNELGALYEAAGVDPESLRYSLAAARSGNVVSIERLGRIYARKVCSDDNELYRYAAQCAYVGLGCEKDIDKTMEILMEGIKLGSASCLNFLDQNICEDVAIPKQTRMRLAKMCLNGSLGTVDHNRAVRFAFTTQSVNDSPLTPEQVELLSDPAVRKNIDPSFMGIILDKHADQLSDSVLADIAQTAESMNVKACFIRHRHFYSRIPFDVGLKLISDNTLRASVACLDYQIYLMENDPYGAGVDVNVCDSYAGDLEKYHGAEKQRYYLTCALVYLANNKNINDHVMRAALFDLFPVPGEAILRRMKIKNREDIRELIGIFGSIVVQRGEAKRQALWPIAAGAPLSLTIAEQLYNMCNYRWYGAPADSLITDLCNNNKDQSDEDYYHSLIAKLRANVFVWVKEAIAACGTEDEKKKITDAFLSSAICADLFFRHTRTAIDLYKELLLSLLGMNTGIDYSQALERLFLRVECVEITANKILYMVIMARQGGYRNIMLRMANYYLNLHQYRLSAALAFDDESVTDLDDRTLSLYLQLHNSLSKEYKISLLVNNIDMLRSRCSELAWEDNDITVELLRNPTLRRRFDIITLITIYNRDRVKAINRARVKAKLSTREKAEFLQYCIETNPNETWVHVYAPSIVNPVIHELMPIDTAAAERLDATWAIVEYVNSRYFSKEFAVKAAAMNLTGILDTIAIIEIKSNCPGLTQLLRFFQHAMKRDGWDLRTRYLPLTFTCAEQLYAALNQHYPFPDKKRVLSIVRSSALMALIAEVDAAEGREQKTKILAAAMTHTLFEKLEERDSIELRETTAVFVFAEISAKYSRSNKSAVLGIIRRGAIADFKASDQADDEDEIEQRKRQDLYRQHRGLSFFGLNDTDAVIELKKMGKGTDKASVKTKIP